ncbi:lysylphosphatidylglycerol synthase domain-containing protein [Candidatus Pelagibacter bacterium nBUS_27]|uniref:lysylphosphatidylglycerol synthase domain-containing protein n=1 Tax=Candidatus Pelagibacter bacterium nBUS_27 TaxID=3374188 RepID=UPI003EC14DBF
MNIFLQVVFLITIILLFVLDKIQLSKISYIFSLQNIDLIFLVFLNNLAISVLFFAIIKKISSDKINFFFINSTFLQGGLIGMIIPGSGLFYKYYKLKNNSKITLLEYSLSQAFLSIFSLICFFFLAILFGFLKVAGVELKTLAIFFILFFTLVYLLYFYRLNIYKFLKKKLLNFNKFKKIYEELKKIKNIIFLNKKYFQFIFILFFVLSLLQCLIFYTATVKFGLDISLINAFFIYLSSILFSTLLLVNFVGLFEITLTISAAFVTKDFLDMIFIGFGLRILNIFSILFWIFLFSGIHWYNKKLMDSKF